MIIKFITKGQRLAKEKIGTVDLKPGTRNIAKLCFDFDHEWDEFRQKAVSFSHDGEHFEVHAPVKGNAVLIPSEFCDSDFFFRITGQEGTKRFVSEKGQVRIRA